MRASCHGTFYTIVVWNDVLKMGRMQAKGGEKWNLEKPSQRLAVKSANNNFVSAANIFHFNPVWRCGCLCKLIFNATGLHYTEGV
jgi:hypothetical protein